MVRERFCRNSRHSEVMLSPSFSSESRTDFMTLEGRPTSRGSNPRQTLQALPRSPQRPLIWIMNRCYAGSIAKAVAELQPATFAFSSRVAEVFTQIAVEQKQSAPGAGRSLSDKDLDFRGVGALDAVGHCGHHVIVGRSDLHRVIREAQRGSCPDIRVAAPRSRSSVDVVSADAVCKRSGPINLRGSGHVISSAQRSWRGWRHRRRISRIEIDA